MGWAQFLERIEKNPRKFAKIMIEELSPPKYVVQGLRKYDWLCSWSGCWNPRMDVCSNCGSSVCEEHSETWIGPKTGLEWYTCQACLNTVPHEEIYEEYIREDEEFWEEDQEELQTSDETGDKNE